MVVEAALPPASDTSEPLAEVASQEANLSKPDLPPESEDTHEEEGTSSALVNEEEDYLYDGKTGRLSFPNLALSCIVPPEAMEKIAIEFYDGKTESQIDSSKKTMIKNITFKYKSGDRTYDMFFILVRDAAEWDIPKEYGPLPAEITRSADGKLVALEVGAELIAEAPENKDSAEAFWRFVEKNQDSIIGSVSFV